MSRLILTDVDDTVLRFVDPFQDWVAGKGFYVSNRWRETYNIADMIGLSSREDITALINGFVRESNGRQPPEECAAEVIPRLRKKGYRFIAITACGEDPTFRIQRAENLAEAFGFEWDDLHMVPQLGCKRKHLERYEGAVWVEDNWGHAVAGADIGHDTFIVTRPHNAAFNDPRITRVTCWRQIEQHLS